MALLKKGWDGITSKRLQGRGRTVSRARAVHGPQKDKQMWEGSSWGSGIHKNSGELASQRGARATQKTGDKMGTPHWVWSHRAVEYHIWSDWTLCQSGM